MALIDASRSELISVIKIDIRAGTSARSWRRSAKHAKRR